MWNIFGEVEHLFPMRNFRLIGPGVYNTSHDTAGSTDDRNPKCQRTKENWIEGLPFLSRFYRLVKTYMTWFWSAPYFCSQLFWYPSFASTTVHWRFCWGSTHGFPMVLHDAIISSHPARRALSLTSMRLGWLLGRSFSKEVLICPELQSTPSLKLT